jgi:N-methylhydantoinase A
MDPILEHFHSTYEKEYTYRLPAPVELVTYHLIAFAEVDRLVPQKLAVNGGTLADAMKGHREVDYLEDGIHPATIYDGDALQPDMQFSGPAIIEEAEATVVLPPQKECAVDAYGNYVITL